jgi:hypothetical protein
MARYIDDVLAFGKNALQLIHELQNDYILKGIGRPEYYLGGDAIELDQIMPDLMSAQEPVI